MTAAPKNILLIGPPGCGKTTVIRRVVERLGQVRLAGFFTQELREHGQRVGFEAVGLDGASTLLARADFRSQHRVGRYGVDLAGFEGFVRQELVWPAADIDLYVIDEIGKMECLSRVFIEASGRVLDSPAAVLATVAVKGGGFIDQVKRRPDVQLMTVAAGNRDQLPALLTSLLQGAP